MHGGLHLRKAWSAQPFMDALEMTHSSFPLLPHLILRMEAQRHKLILSHSQTVTKLLLMNGVLTALSNGTPSTQQGVLVAKCLPDSSIYRGPTVFCKPLSSQALEGIISTFFQVICIVFKRGEIKALDKTRGEFNADLERRRDCKYCAVNMNSVPIFGVPETSHFFK